MKRVMSSTCGLTAVQERIWKFCREHQAAHGTFARMVDIRRNVFAGLSDYPILQPARVCITRGYLIEREKRVYEALDPPHERIVRDVLQETGVARKDLFARYRGRKACRARRLITKRLRALRYPCSDIGRLLKRSPTVVEEYGKPERRLKRSNARRETYLRQRAAQQQQLGA